MQLRPFGSLGAKVPVIGQGTWKMEDDPAAAIAAIRRGLDLGMTHVDTAELYGAGRVEELCVAPAIAGRRAEVYLVSKVKPDNASLDGTVRACHRSLKRLKTDYLDCYLLHWPGPHPLQETISAFEQLVRDGKIRSWGVSNFDVAELDATYRIAGPGRIACNQVNYHLQAREIEVEVVPWCAAHGVTVVGYSPFGAGKFPSPSSKGGKVLADIAKARGVTPYAVALAFLVRDPHTLGIPKSSNVAHVESNRRAGELELTTAEIERVDAAFPLHDGS